MMCSPTSLGLRGAVRDLLETARRGVSAWRDLQSVFAGYTESLALLALTGCTPLVGCVVLAGCMALMGCTAETPSGTTPIASCAAPTCSGSVSASSSGPPGSDGPTLQTTPALAPSGPAGGEPATTAGNSSLDEGYTSGESRSVAVGNSPLGPFTDAIGGPLVSDTSEMAAFDYSDPGETVYTIDPTVFVDDDGQAYLLYGGFWRLVIAKLGEDMISIEGEMIERTPPNFFEAPYLFKREGVYYLAYAGGSNPATIDYVTATSPMGPWEHHGQVLDTLPNLPGQDAATSHPAVAQFAGQWYLVYHRSDGANGGTYRRQVAVDKLSFAGDGSINPVSPSSGLTF